MEEVEIPTIYFSPPKHTTRRGGQPHSRDFWNKFSKSQGATTAVLNFRKVLFHKLCDDTTTHGAGDKVGEAQSDHMHQHQSHPRPPSAVIKPRQKKNHRSNAKLKLPFKWHQVLLLIGLLALSLFCQVSEECPVVCECKWKSGKESVICANAKTKLTAIPSGLEPGTQLLDLSRNNIQILQSKVFQTRNLLNLQKIFLSECNLKTLEKNVFYKLNNLVELNLSSNKLEAIPTHTFEQIPEIRELKMNSNPVTRISNNAFSTLTRLVRLELSRCRIRFVDSYAFRGLISLEWLKLDNNRLLTIQAVSFSFLRNLQTLNLSDNPWNCTCSLQPLRDWMSKNNIPYSDPPVCSSPSRLVGKSWNQLQREDFACVPKVQNSVLAETGELTKAIEGENATLVCRLQATADTQVRWIAGSRPISSSSSSRYSLSESFLPDDGEKVIHTQHQPLTTSTSFSGAKQSLGTKTSRLTVIKTKLQNSGTYSCRAETRAGSVSANFTLQVMQLNAEQHSGRFLLYGTTVAAILTLIICIAILCVVFFCGKRKCSISAEDKTEHVSQNGRISSQNGHCLQSRNGGTNVPLLQNHNRSSPSSNGTPKHRPLNNIGNGLLRNFNIAKKPDIEMTRPPVPINNIPPNRGLLNPQYKALPTQDDSRDVNLDHDSSSDLEDNEIKNEPDFSTCNNRNSKVFVVDIPEPLNPSTSVSVSATSENKFPDLINEESSSNRHKNVDNSQAAVGSPPEMTSTAKSSPCSSEEHVQPVQTVNSHRRPNSESLSQPPQSHGLSSPLKLQSNEPTDNTPPPQSVRICNSSATPIPKNSTSNSNAKSKNEYPYASTYQTAPSTPPTYTKFTFTQKPAPLIPAPRHQRTSSFSSSETHTESRPTGQNPNHISYYRLSSNCGQQLPQRRGPPFQRRSEPTSPIHHPAPQPYHHQYHRHHHLHYQNQGSDPGLINHQAFVGQSQEYDYHAAQLAAFLEEYRLLQMELMRMSASLTEMDSAPVTGGNNTNSNINLNSVDNNPMIHLHQQQRLASSSNNANNFADFHPNQQQQFKSILKSSAPNNNYLV
ncbi:Leucine-rich repeat-containing protein 4B [Folsomia candida]|uniref:Leucine-rich repeat-containing protein 4B n=2 Tax=Folsomia candida TaxID=158441 RepID=A0A226EK60_FOLCA|nr:Leucine-rich repeat-containing protein 4B [Folsomia candida]